MEQGEWERVQNSFPFPLPHSPSPIHAYNLDHEHQMVWTGMFLD